MIDRVNKLRDEVLEQARRTAQTMNKYSCTLNVIGMNEGGDGLVHQEMRLPHPGLLESRREALTEAADFWCGVAYALDIVGDLALSDYDAIEDTYRRVNQQVLDEQTMGTQDPILQ